MIALFLRGGHSRNGGHELRNSFFLDQGEMVVFLEPVDQHIVVSVGSLIEI